MVKFFLKDINYINAETGINRLKIFLDLILCNLKYGLNSSDYKIYKVYNLKPEIRKELLSYRKNKSLIFNYNKIINQNIFKFRDQFNKKFNAFIEQKWLHLNGNNILEFSDFIKDKKVLYFFSNLKSNNNFYKIEVSKKNYTNTYNELVLKKYPIVQTKIVENNKLSKINPKSLNIIRFILLNQNIYAAYLVTSKSDLSITEDNNIYASINLETGIIDYKGVSKEQNYYEIHPLTNEDIVWFQIVKWPRTKRFVVKIAESIKELKYLEIDVTITVNGPTLLNINPNPNYQLFQLLNLVNYNIGLMKNIKELLKEK